MISGPGLVMRGFVLGSLFVGIVTWLLTAGTDYSQAINNAPSLMATIAAGEAISQGEKQPADGNSVSKAEESGDCQVSSKFPARVLRWCTLITQYAYQYHLAPDLVASVVWLESGGNPKAYSGSGAVGLMQVMASDGLAASFYCGGGPCFADRPSREQLNDPDFNIKYGTRMLAGLVKRNGSLREALKSYGPLDAGYTYADRVLALYQKYGR